MKTGNIIEKTEEIKVLCGWKYDSTTKGFLVVSIVKNKAPFYFLSATENNPTSTSVDSSSQDLKDIIKYIEVTMQYSQETLKNHSNNKSLCKIHNRFLSLFIQFKKDMEKHLEKELSQKAIALSLQKNQTKLGYIR